MANVVINGLIALEILPMVVTTMVTNLLVVTLKAPLVVNNLVADAVALKVDADVPDNLNFHCF